MNGLQQVAAMTKLAEQVHSLEKIHIGDVVRLGGIETCFQVTGIDNPVLTLKAPSGREITATWRSVRKVRR